MNESYVCNNTSECRRWEGIFGQFWLNNTPWWIIILVEPVQMKVLIVAMGRIECHLLMKKQIEKTFQYQLSSLLDYFSIKNNSEIAVLPVLATSLLYL